MEYYPCYFIYDYISIFRKIFLGAEINNPNILAYLLILILTVFIFVDLGIIPCALSTLFFKKRDPMVFLIHFSVSLLYGVYFPISLLPESLQGISYILPLTYALKGLRQALLDRYSVDPLPSDLMILVISLAVLAPISFGVFNYAPKKIKMEGRLFYG